MEFVIKHTQILKITASVSDGVTEEDVRECIKANADKIEFAERRPIPTGNGAFAVRIELIDVITTKKELVH